MASSPATYEQLKHRLRLRLAEALHRESRNGEQPTVDRSTISTQLQLVLDASRGEPQIQALTPQEHVQLITELTDELSASGPLEPLLNDETITEIMVNGPQQVYIERQGRLERTNVRFRDANHLMSVIERLLDAAGVSVTESEPYADASLPDSTRLNVVIPPLVLNGPTLTNRKKMRQWSMDDFVSLESLSLEAATFLAACVKAKVNFVISGGTSTGKTTLVSILSNFIPQE